MTPICLVNKVMALCTIVNRVVVKWWCWTYVKMLRLLIYRNSVLAGYLAGYLANLKAGNMWWEIWHPAIFFTTSNIFWGEKYPFDFHNFKILFDFVINNCKCKHLYI